MARDMKAEEERVGTGLSKQSPCNLIGAPALMASFVTAIRPQIEDQSFINQIETDLSSKVHGLNEKHHTSSNNNENNMLKNH